MRVSARSVTLTCVVLIMLTFAPISASGTGRTAAVDPTWSWQQSASRGFGAGAANLMAMPMVQFKGKLYVGVTSEEGAQVRVKSGASWSKLNGTPWSASDLAIIRMQVYGGYLYAGTANLESGCGLWRYDGSAWTDALALPGAGGKGFGDKYNLAVTAMEVFDDELYVGMTNYVLDKITSFQLYTEGVKIWKYDGSTWVEVDGKFPADQFNAGVFSFKVYNGWLYACTIRFEIGISVKSWSPLQLQIDLKARGCQLLRTDGAPTGYNWSLVADNGFSDSKNLTSTCMLEYGGKLYIGTANGTISLVYDVASRKIAGYSYDSNGLCIYSYSGSGSPVVVVKNGFGSNSDIAAVCMDKVTMSGRQRLMVGTASASGPGKLEAFDGTAWAPGAIDGFGGADNNGIMSLATVSESGKDKVYAGTLNPEEGCEVWSGLPASRVFWYLAEGSSNWGFDTYVTIENPNPQAVIARVTYMTGAGARTRPDITLPAMSQTAINPRDDLGGSDFSTRVECLQGKPIAVDRRMIWTGPGAASQEGHSSIGVMAPAPAWYLAEGSSAWGFETWLLIQNPNSGEAVCEVTYMIEGKGPESFTKKVPANSRASFNMAEDIGSADASIRVVGSQPVICERAMYRNNRREGHDSIGTTGPAKDYFLAEGTTAWGFTTYILVQNPNGSDNTVNITYMTPAGPVTQDPFVVPANSRKTIRVNDFAGGRDLSTRVRGSLPLIAERAMYWDNGSGEACHDSIGMSSPHSTFYLPDGETSNRCETWTLVQNPDSSAVQIEVQYLTPSGKGNIKFTDTIKASSRKTYDLAERIPAGRAAIMVTCKTAGKKIMVERAMYWNSRGAGTDTIGGYSD